MQSWAILHSEMPLQAPLREEICGQLHRAAKAGSDHRGTDAPVETPEALCPVDFPQAIYGILVAMLCTYW